MQTVFCEKFLWINPILKFAYGVPAIVGGFCTCGGGFPGLLVEDFSVQALKAINKIAPKLRMDVLRTLLPALM